MFNFTAARTGVVSGRRWMSDSSIDLGPTDTLVEAHVLAVDDSLIDRKVIERLLKTTSCKVTAVDSGMRALEFLGLDAQQRTSVVDELKIDLIITDYCMPGMTGYELLKKIKESSTFKETPVVIMSSENVIARIDRCLEEGAEEFILKPVKLSDVKRLRDYMNKDDTKSDQIRKQIGVNKRKQMDGGSDNSSESASPVSLSPPSISPSSSSTSSMASQISLSSAPSSPCGPFDSPETPTSPSGPSDSPSRRPKLDDVDDDNDGDQSDSVVGEDLTTVIP